jgi:selenide,water dikinase
MLPHLEDPNLLVGLDTGDDAAVYRLGEDLALVQTVDFFPPIVDDPYWYGAIAAANALSDVYAKGGRPILALNILCYPMGLDKAILAQILKGGHEKAHEAGVLIVGGHTIDDVEPKYGLAVTGLIKPGAQVTNAAARPGDALVLTKPIGTGIITTAGKQDQTDQKTVERAIQVMAALNRAASEAMLKVGVNACTDVTGFGLLGHLRTIAKASGVGARISLSAVPVIPGAWELAEAGIAPGGTHRNLESVEKDARWHRDISPAAKLLLCDAQTSGGLLIALPHAKAPALLRELEARDVQGVVVGEVTEAGRKRLEVRV